VTNDNQERPTTREHPCLWDTASLEGLKTLEKRWPTRWRDYLWRYARQHYPVTSTTVVQDLLGTRFDRRCLPGRTTSVSTLSAPRSYAGRLRCLLPPHLPVIQITSKHLDHLERDFVSRGETPEAASQLVAYLRTLVNEALGQLPGLAPLPDRRWRASSSLGEVRVRPADLSVVAENSGLRVRAVLGLLLLKGATRRALARIECGHLIGYSAVQLSGVTWPIPEFVAHDLSQLRGAALGGRWLFPGNTTEGPVAERTLSRWLADAGLVHLGRPLQIADVRRLGRRLQDGRRGRELRRDVLDLRSWEDFGRLVVPGVAPQRVRKLAAATELRGLRSQLKATQRSLCAEQERVTELEEWVRGVFGNVERHLRMGRKDHEKLAKRLMEVMATASSRGWCLDRLTDKVRDLQERLDSPTSDAELESPPVEPEMPKVPVSYPGPTLEPATTTGPGLRAPAQASPAEVVEALVGLMTSGVTSLLECDPQDLEAALQAVAAGRDPGPLSDPYASLPEAPGWEPQQEVVPVPDVPYGEHQYTYDDYCAAFGLPYDPEYGYPPSSTDPGVPDGEHHHAEGGYYAPQFEPTSSG